MKKQMLSILEGNKTNLSSRWVWRPAGCRDIPHPVLLGQEEKQPCFTRDVEDPRTLRAARCTPPTSGMTDLFYHGNNAFTLIELLVVVLIIGILAAVAVPQYQKVIIKSRLAAVIPTVKAMKQAAEVYYLEHGAYSDYITDYDIEFPCEGAGYCITKDHIAFAVRSYNEMCTWDVAATLMKDDNKTALFNYSICLDHADRWGGKEYCGAPQDSQNLKNICLSMGGVHYKNGNIWIGNKTPFSFAVIGGWR